MKVAIIGAGLSGLSCALELQRNGIRPDIYEKKDYIGDECDFTAVRLNMLEPGPANPLRHLRNRYGLVLEPYQQLKSMVVISQSKRVRIRGRLGYLFIRGRFPESAENQLARNLKIPVHFNRFVHPEDLSDDYDYIVISTGNITIPESSGIWISNMKGFVRVATVAEQMPDSSIKVWLNTNYSRNCFCYMTPGLNINSRLVLVVDNISYSELDHYWENFINGENFRFSILETRDQEFDTGFPKSPVYGNMLFTGNAGGFLDNFAGFGMRGAIESGFMAAKAITNRTDYKKQVACLLKKKKKVNELRNLVATFDNGDYDRTVSILSIPGIKHFIYNNPLFRAHSFSAVASLLSRLKNHSIK